MSPPALRPIFIHIPKTGGVSVQTIFNIHRGLPHSSIVEYVDTFGLSTVQSSYVFTIVRNPWDQAVDWWEYHRTIHPQHLFVQADCVEFYSQFSDFNQWATAGCPHHWNRKFRVPAGVDHPLNQTAYFTHPSVFVDVQVFPFERFDAMVDVLNEKIGARAPLDVHTNQTIIKYDYRTYYKTQQAIDAVAQINRQVIDSFGYHYQ
jgi:hypothetical protein